MAMKATLLLIKLAAFSYFEEGTPEYQARLIEFGCDYLKDARELSEIDGLISDYRRQAEWDLDAEGIVTFLIDIKRRQNAK